MGENIIESLFALIITGPLAKILFRLICALSNTVYTTVSVDSPIDYNAGQSSKLLLQNVG